MRFVFKPLNVKAIWLKSQLDLFWFASQAQSQYFGWLDKLK